MASLPSAAQDAPKTEIFGGYSNLRPEESGFGSTGHGAAVGATYYVRKSVGINADWSGHWFETDRFPLFGPRGYSEVEASNQYLTIGPQFRLLDAGRLTINLRGGVGAVRRHTKGANVFEEDPPGIIPFDDASWRFAGSVGGSVDFRMSDRFSWRIFQPDVMIWRTSINRTDFRASTGLVVRFGRR